MDHSSDGESDISESEIDERVEKYYSRLKAGKYKIRNAERTYKCPFCVGKKKQDYNLKDLLQHATGIGASNRKGKLRATHRALEKYIRNDVSETSGKSVRLAIIEPPQPHSSKNRDEQFVWPWMGILVNVPRDFKDGRFVGESGNRLKEQLSRFNPLKVHALWNYKGHTGNAIVDFSKDWSGFRDSMAFENHFESEHYGKTDYLERKHKGTDLFGWVARAEDYNSPGPIGEHLKKNGDLKTINDLTSEESRKTDSLVRNLASEIEGKNRHLQELESKYNETNLALDKMMEQRDQLFQAYNEGDHLRKKADLKSLSDLANEESRKSDKLLAYLTSQIEVKNKSLEELEFKYNETNLSLDKMTEQRNQVVNAYNEEIHKNKKLQAELESKMRELDRRREQLEKLAAQSESDKRKLGGESVVPLTDNFNAQSPSEEVDTVEIVEKVREFSI